MRSWLEQKIEEYEGHPDLITHQVLLDITEQIASQMLAKGVKKRDLAERLGVSRSYVTRMLEGTPNLTVRSLVRVSLALDCDLQIGLRPRANVRWWQGGIPHEFEVGLYGNRPAEATNAAQLAIAA